MNYIKLYSKIIDKHGTVIKPKDGYYERHHIVPKCIGGTNLEDNLTYVSARVHFVLHRLLCKIHPTEGKLIFAFWAMCNQKTGDVVRTYKVTSATYQIAKEQFAEENSKRHKGKKMSKEWVDNLRVRMTGNKINPKGSLNKLTGVARSQDVKAKISKTKQDNPLDLPSFKGFYVTPFGIFSNVPLATRASGVSQYSIRVYCENGRVVTEQLVRYSKGILTASQVGMLLQEIGWYFVSKDDEQFERCYQNLTS